MALHQTPGAYGLLRIPSKRRGNDSWMKSLKRGYEWIELGPYGYRPTPEEAMSRAELLGILNEESRPCDTVVAAAGSPPGDLHKLWEVSAGRLVISNSVVPAWVMRFLRPWECEWPNRVGKFTS